jgi:hypothetical protein
MLAQVLYILQDDWASKVNILSGDCMSAMIGFNSLNNKDEIGIMHGRTSYASCTYEMCMPGQDTNVFEAILAFSPASPIPGIPGEQKKDENP